MAIDHLAVAHLMILILMDVAAVNHEQPEMLVGTASLKPFQRWRTAGTLRFSLPVLKHESNIQQHQLINSYKSQEYHDKHGHQLPVLRDLKGSFYVRDERDGILSLGKNSWIESCCKFKSINLIQYLLFWAGETMCLGSCLGISIF